MCVWDLVPAIGLVAFGGELARLPRIISGSKYATDTVHMQSALHNPPETVTRFHGEYSPNLEAQPPLVAEQMVGRGD